MTKDGVLLWLNFTGKSADMWRVKQTASASYFWVCCGRAVNVISLLSCLRLFLKNVLMITKNWIYISLLYAEVTCVYVKSYFLSVVLWVFDIFLVPCCCKEVWHFLFFFITKVQQSHSVGGGCVCFFVSLIFAFWPTIFNQSWKTKSLEMNWFHLGLYLVAILILHMM